MDEGVVERGEDAGNAEDELALTDLGTKLRTQLVLERWDAVRRRVVCAASAMAGSSHLDVLLRTALDLLLGRHVGCVLVTG